jgi:hypothetical protein
LEVRVAENKTKKTTVSPAAFIGRIADEGRRKECRELIALMRAATGHRAKMWGASIVGFDEYQYKYASGRDGSMLLTGFSPRQNALVLYLGPGLQNKALMSKLGKHKAGKGCLYLKKLDNVDRKVLRTLIAHSVETMRKRHSR